MTEKPRRRAVRSTARPMWRRGRPARAAFMAAPCASRVAATRRRATGSIDSGGPTGALAPVSAQ